MDSKNDNTLLWLALIALGAYVWWTRNKTTPWPGAQAANSNLQTAIPGTSSSIPAGGQPASGNNTVPVTITQQTVNGIGRPRGLKHFA